MTNKHAKLGASSSERWINCPASVRMCENLPNTSSVFAAEGTAAHELSEKCLVMKSRAIHFLGKNINGFIVDEDMAQNVQNYVDYVLSVNGSLLIEQKVDFSRWVHEGFGTSDAIVIDEQNNTLHVIDLKYGKGVAVYAQDNTQAQLYALGAYDLFAHIYDIDFIKMHIHQPRINNITSWEITVDELLEFGDEVKKRADATLDENAPFNPTEKGCMWCAAKPTCSALAQKTFEVVTADFEITAEPTLLPVDNLTPEQIAQILPNLPLIESWIKSVKEHAYDLANVNQLQGYKLVAGRNSRKWNADDDAIKSALTALGVNPIKQELISVAQAEKLISKENKSSFSSLYAILAGSPTLAIIDDKRPALTNILDDFDQCKL